MVGECGHSLPVPPLPSQGSGRWEGGTEAAAAAASCRCLGRLSNFRARRQSARPCVLLVGLFNPKPHARLLLVQVTGKRRDCLEGSSPSSLSVSLSFCARDLIDFTNRRRQTSSLCLSVSLFLSQYTQIFSLPLPSLSLLPLSVESRMFRMATLLGLGVWQGERCECVLCVLRLMVVVVGASPR